MLAGLQVEGLHGLQRLELGSLVLHLGVTLRGEEYLVLPALAVPEVDQIILLLEIRGDDLIALRLVGRLLGLLGRREFPWVHQGVLGQEVLTGHRLGALVEHVGLLGVLLEFLGHPALELAEHLLVHLEAVLDEDGVQEEVAEAL